MHASAREQVGRVIEERCTRRGTTERYGGNGKEKTESKWKDGRRINITERKEKKEWDAGVEEGEDVMAQTFVNTLQTDLAYPAMNMLSLLGH